MKKASMACLMASSVVVGSAGATVATFDSLAEGDLGLSFTDSGMTFFNLDDRTGAGFVPFSCERADGILSGSGFSPSNALGFGSWVPGSGAAFQQCGSFWISPGAVQTFASVDVFEWLSPAGNIISLEAYRNGVMVGSAGAVIPGNGLINHWTLSVSGVSFDTLRVVGSGPSDRGIFIGLVDNVLVIPAPASAVGLLSLLATCRRR